MTRIFFFCLAVSIGPVTADETILLPFTGLFESRGGVAKEKLATGQWRDIPQDVQLLIVRDADIIELRMRIQVSSDEDSSDTQTYTIANDTWLVGKPGPSAAARSDQIEFDVYKKSPGSDRFEDKGDGVCSAFQCSFSYVTAKPGHEQRYDSDITWQPGREGIEFRQSGGLSLKRDGDPEWTTFKTWDNRFKRVAQSP